MASIEQQLLHAALLCGLAPGKEGTYRMQLFLVANRDLGSKSHQSDFQRALETAVDRKGLFENQEYRGSGAYMITKRGYDEAHRQLGPIEQIYEPVEKSQFRATITGTISGALVEIRTRAATSSVYINREKTRSAKEACERIATLAGIRISTQGESAVRVLQDICIDRGFNIEFE